MPYDPEKWYNYYIREPHAAFNRLLYQNPLVVDWVQSRGARGNIQFPTALQCLADRTAHEQFKLDCALWYGTLTAGAGSPEKTALVNRIFQVLYHGGLCYLRGGQWQPWFSCTAPLASVMAHGGRFVIQLPFAEHDDDNGFFNWLGGGVGGGNIIAGSTRLAATHGIQPLDFRDMRPMCAGRYQRVHEIKKGSLPHYGVNIALGGQAMLHPIRGRITQANGEYGHLYIYYMPPTTTTYGGVLIGCEGSAPVDSWENTDYYMRHGQRMGKVTAGLHVLKAMIAEHLGHDESMWTPDPTGGYHKVGQRQTYGAGGGHKWDQLNDGPEKVYNSMIVDLTSTGWKFLQNARPFDANRIGGNGAPLRPTNRPFANAPVLQATVLTHTNFKTLEATFRNIRQDVSAFRKRGYVDAKLDLDSKHQKKILGLIAVGKATYRHKRMSEIMVGSDMLGQRINPNGGPMDRSVWITASKAWGARNRIRPVDNAVTNMINTTSKFISDYEPALNMGCRLSPQNEDLIDRIVMARKVLGAISIYIIARGTEGARSKAIRVLEALVNREVQLLEKAQQDMARYA